MDISVAQAADELGLDPSRVRHLARTGALRGRRLGTTWLLDHDAVARRARTECPPGRPLSARRAWAAVSLLAGDRPGDLTASARGQVRAVLVRRAGSGADSWSASMRNLAEQHELSVHASVLSRVLRSRLVRDAALPTGRLGLVVPRPVSSVFVAAGDWTAFADQVGVDLVRATGPERLRVLLIPDFALDVVADDQRRELASIAVATGDGEPRVRDAAAATLNELAAQLSAVEGSAGGFRR